MLIVCLFSSIGLYLLPLGVKVEFSCTETESFFFSFFPWKYLILAGLQKVNTLNIVSAESDSSVLADFLYTSQFSNVELIEHEYTYFSVSEK